MPSSAPRAIPLPATRKPELPPRRRSIGEVSGSKLHVRPSHSTFPAQPASPTKQKGRRLHASKSGHEEDRIALIRAPRAETNHGKDPESRAYIRGVLHTHPWHLRFGSVFSLFLAINLPAAVISAFLLLLSGEHPEAFGWVPGWLLVFPIALPLTGFGYLLWGMAGKCLVCKQRLFVHKGARKHVNAHRIKCLGFIIPLCLHMLAFHWFRCSSCGTPVRLRK